MRRHISTIAFLAALLVAASCSNTSGGDDTAPTSGAPQASATAPTSGAAPTTISLLVFGEAEELRAYRSLVEAFEARQTETKVELVEVADRQALLTRLSTSLAAGDPPDLFLINYRFFGQFAVRDVLEPLQGRLDTSDVLDEAAFYDLALQAFRYPSDDLTCLPQNVSSLVVYFNKDLFQRAGVAEPTTGWTWDDMVDAASKLTSGEQYGLGVEPSIIRLAPFVWSNGADIVDDQVHPTRLTLDSPAALDALDRFLRLRTDGVIPTYEESEAEDDESRFANGRLAMLMQSRRVTPTFRLIDSFEWDVAPLPVLSQPAGILHSDAYCLTKASPNHDAAWQFLEFALGEEGATFVAETGRTVPSLRSVAESEAFLDPAKPPPSSRVFLDSIPAIRALPTISTWPEVEDAANAILAEARQTAMPAAEVAQKLDEATREIFARAEG